MKRSFETNHQAMKPIIMVMLISLATQLDRIELEQKAIEEAFSELESIRAGENLEGIQNELISNLMELES